MLFWGSFLEEKGTLLLEERKMNAGRAVTADINYIPQSKKMQGNYNSTTPLSSLLPGMGKLCATQSISYSQRLISDKPQIFSVKSKIYI